MDAAILMFPPSHGGNRGSTPLGDAITENRLGLPPVSGMTWVSDFS